jgi:hypothetical protein
MRGLGHAVSFNDWGVEGGFQPPCVREVVRCSDFL